MNAQIFVPEAGLDELLVDYMAHLCRALSTDDQDILYKMSRGEDPADVAEYLGRPRTTPINNWYQNLWRRTWPSVEKSEHTMALAVRAIEKLLEADVPSTAMPIVPENKIPAVRRHPTREAEPLSIDLDRLIPTFVYIAAGKARSSKEIRVKTLLAAIVSGLIIPEAEFETLYGKLRGWNVQFSQAQKAVLIRQAATILQDEGALAGVPPYTPPRPVVIPDTSDELPVRKPFVVEGKRGFIVPPPLPLTTETIGQRVGQRVIRAMGERGVPLGILATRLNITPTQLVEFISGKAVLSAADLVRIAHLLKKDLRYFSHNIN